MARVKWTIDDFVFSRDIILGGDTVNVALDTFKVSMSGTAIFSSIESTCPLAQARQACHAFKHVGTVPHWSLFP